MNALVLSGGSIKGAFQAGAVAHLLQAGFVPRMAYGISVGALNCAFLADRSGRMVRDGRPVDWPRLGRELEQFWVDSVTRPEDLIRERGFAALAWAIARRRFNGVVSTEPLHQLVRREAKRENIQRTPLHFFVGAVNLTTGEIDYEGKECPEIVDYVIASSAIPISMPLVKIRGEPYYDGGMRDIAPLGKAINEGATHIAAVICQTEKVVRKEIDTQSVLQLVSRVVDVMTNEILENDLKVVERVNEMLREAGPESAVAARYRPIPVLAVRPETAIEVDIESFTRADIRRMLDLGREAARKALEEDPDWVAGMTVGAPAAT